MPDPFLQSVVQPEIRHLQFDFLRATEMAALNSIAWIGKGQKEAADAAACDAIRGMFDAMPMRGEVIVGEGIKDQAPGLFSGERVGQWQPWRPRVDIAVDPLDGTTNLSKGLPNAISCIAAAIRADDDQPALQDVPAFYMKKLAYPAVVRQAWIADPSLPLDIRAPLTDVIQLTARLLGKQVRDVVVMVLDRPRNARQIDEIRTAGASLRMISDGDIAAALAPGIAGSGIDLYVGIGGAPEGLLSAAGLRCIGGGMQAQMWPRDAQELESLVNCGWSSSVDNVYRSRDLASGDDILFAATGICDSPLLRGVETRGPTVITHSVIMRLKSGSVRYVRTEHDLSRRPIRLRSALPPGADAPPRGALEIGQPQPPHRGPTIGVSDDLERRQRIPAIVLMGPPGSGKGTLGRRLEEALDLQHLSSGDIIRRALHGDGERTRQWSAVNGGRLIGDDDLWEVFDATLREVQAAVGGAAPPRTLLIDGIPRNESQVDALAQRVQVRAVICLECADDSILVDRLRSRGASEGRGDDAADATIRRRLAVHREQTLPALRRYPGQIVRRVDAAQPVPAVCRDVIRHLVMLNAV